jgi:uncharacterized repeat protein (TIGR02543 family)
MKRHTLFLAGILGLTLVFGLLLFTGCDLSGDDTSYTVSYAVSYDENGGKGTVPPSDTLHEDDEEGTILTIASGSGLTKDGYKFSHWNTKADGTGDSYVPYTIIRYGDLEKYGSDITLYAQWKNLAEIFYTLSFNMNGADSGGVVSPLMKLNGSTIPLPDTGGISKSGYKFSGWNTERYGLGTAYAAGDSFTITEDITLYAQWTVPLNYTVSYNANGGTGTVPKERTAQSGSTITLPKDKGYNDSSYYSSYELTRFGYTFSGWNTTADGTGTTYAADASFTIGEGNTTLYAQWTEIVEISERVYAGVVAFNATTIEYALSNNLGKAKIFIHDKDNDVDSTALCYAVSKAATLFGAADLPPLDNLFIVSFTDGNDNFSSSLYTGVTQAEVYNKAKTDLEGIPGMKSYAIGFGSSIDKTNMLKLVHEGQYRTASPGDLNSVFQDIAYTVLASSQNVELVTNNVFTDAEHPKYFQIQVTAKGDTTYFATVKCKLVGTTFEIISDNAGDDADLSFDTPVIATVVGNKMHIPLNNIKYVRDGSEWYLSDIKVKVSDDDVTYRTDTEDSSTSTSNNTKKTGVVLVLDCSKSLGESFESVKTAAYSFINTLRDAQD